MRTLLQISSLLLIAMAATASYFYLKSNNTGGAGFKNFKGTGRAAPETLKKSRHLAIEKLKLNAGSLERFAIQKGYRTDIAFMVDMNIESGRPRFFVYNMKKDSMESSGLVTHGYGSSTIRGLRFSNVPGSNATSLGRYKIGQAYRGRFGLAYKLHGLDKTNSKAFERFVVLHAHDCVPDHEVPYSICESQGCPTVSPVFLQTLKKYLDKPGQPTLLEIYQ